MPNRHRLSEPQARAHARAWLEQQHTDAHELLVTLLHYVPEPDRTRALSQLTTGCTLGLSSRTAATAHAVRHVLASPSRPHARFTNCPRQAHGPPRR